MRFAGGQMLDTWWSTAQDPCDSVCSVTVSGGYADRLAFRAVGEEVHGRLILLPLVGHSFSIWHPGSRFRLRELMMS